MADQDIEFAIAAPPGQTSHYASVNDPDTLWKYNALCQCLCVGVPGILLLLRIYVRLWVKRLWILEDWLAIMSFLALSVYSSLITAVVYQHGGTHQWNVRKQDLENIIYWINCTQITYGTAASFIKCTILILYLRVFSPSRRSALAIGIRTFMAVIIMYYVSLAVSKICQCIPRRKIWQPSTPGQCVSLPIILNISGAFNIFSDFAILFIPVQGLWNLQMTFKRKLGVFTVFTVGIVGPAFSIIGLVKRLQLSGSKDMTFNQVEILLWANAELATGLLIICLPVLPGILHRRKSRPSVTIANGSRTRKGTSKFYPSPYNQNSDDDANELVKSGHYLELEEGHNNGSGGRPHDYMYSSNVRAGYEVGEEGLPASAVISAAAEQKGQILKTVTVEQTRT